MQDKYASPVLLPYRCMKKPPKAGDIIRAALSTEEHNPNTLLFLMSSMKFLALPMLLLLRSNSEGGEYKQSSFFWVTSMSFVLELLFPLVSAIMICTKPTNRLLDTATSTIDMISL